MTRLCGGGFASRFSRPWDEFPPHAPVRSPLLCPRAGLRPPLRGRREFYWGCVMPKKVRTPVKMICAASAVRIRPVILIII